MSYNFQKWYYTILFTLFLACAPDDITSSQSYTPQNLKMATEEGLKFQSQTLTDESIFNFKTSQSGRYELHLLDFTNTLVSKDRFNAQSGDNVLTFYTKALQGGDYTLKFYTVEGQLKQTEKLFVK
tara:strand:+ start:993 stop:1370 length:378 start_codon:yes stop_codon:yes gene_type:complete